MVTISSEEVVRWCLKVTTRVLSFPTLPDMCAFSWSKSPVAPLGRLDCSFVASP